MRVHLEDLSQALFFFKKKEPISLLSPCFYFPASFTALLCCGHDGLFAHLSSFGAERLCLKRFLSHSYQSLIRERQASQAVENKQLVNSIFCVTWNQDLWKKNNFFKDSLLKKNTWVISRWVWKRLLLTGDGKENDFLWKFKVTKNMK